MAPLHSDFLADQRTAPFTGSVPGKAAIRSEPKTKCMLASGLAGLACPAYPCALPFERPRYRAQVRDEAVQRIHQAFAHQRVVHELAALLAAYETGVLEYLQMLGDRRLGHLEACRDLARGALGLR